MSRCSGIFLCDSVFTLPVTHAAVCEPKAFHGAYGFVLTGSTTIGGTARPVAVVGRLILDGSGNLTGVSSASFTGLVFGNPVTGCMRLTPHTDCSVTWNLQDDSGNFQHFAGTISADGSRATFRQIDPGGAENGALLRTLDACSDSSFAGTFNVTASGRSVDVYTAADSGTIFFKGLLIADGAGNLSFAQGPDDPAVAAGTYKQQDGCFVELVLKLPNETAPLRFRAIVVENGREVQGIETDPGTTVALRLVGKADE